MAGFLYFAPKRTTPIATAADAAALGLGYAFSGGCEVAGTLCMGHTLTGEPGYIFADTKRLGEWQSVMQLDAQTWRKVPGTDCYVGFWNDAPPTPDDLMRPVQLPGYRVTVGDHDWTVPLTARFDDARKLLVT